MANDEVPKLSSPAEQEANAARLLAETEKFKAETRGLNAKALQAEHEAEVKEIAKRIVIEDDRAMRASDVFNNVYRFSATVSDASVRSCMNELTVWRHLNPDQPIEVIFSSPGGSVIDGFVLFDFLRDLSDNQDIHIITGVSGMAASMAGILVQAGDERWMGSQAWYMIHRTAFGAMGKSYEIEDQVKWVKRIEDRVVDIFVKRSNLTSKKIRSNWDRKDWWIDSDEAIKFGLVDEIR